MRAHDTGFSTAGEAARYGRRMGKKMKKMREELDGKVEMNYSQTS
jgi:hypothetical protein